MHNEGTQMYRVKAVAEMFDVSVSMIYRAIEGGQLAALKIGSGKGSLRISAAAVREFHRACAAAAHQAYVVDGESASAAGGGGLRWRRWRAWPGLGLVRWQ